ncbi:MAG: helix-turn-helix transcriptional regulator [Bacteroidales bacterium]
MLRIKELCREKGITGRELAVKLGMSEVGLYKTISDNGNPPLRRLEEIATALGVPVSELFYDSQKSTLTCPNCGKEIKVELTKPEE